MKHKNQIQNALGQLFISGLLAASAMLPATAQAITINLTDTTIDSGTIGGVIFYADRQQPTGSGVINPFLRLRGPGPNGNSNHAGTEQGYNTNASANQVFDNQPPAGPGDFTHAMLLGDLSIFNGFYTFYLDINEPGSNASLLSLDGLRLFAGDSSFASLQNTTVDPVTGDWVGAGQLLWSLDTAASDNTILLDATRGGGPGSGASDLLVQVPVSVFNNVSSSANIILWSRFGLQQTADSGLAADSGYEEWFNVKVAIGETCADPGYAAANPDECGGTPPFSIPEPGSIALLGMGLLGLAMSRKQTVL